MKRHYSFSMREKVLIGVFVVILAVAAWYYFLLSPCQNTVSTASGQVSDIQVQIDDDNIKLSRMQTMQEEIAAAKAAGTATTTVPAYDNSVKLIAMLNTVLSSADDYSLSFEDPVAGDDNTMRRTLSLTFGCGSYDQAVQILKELSTSGFACSIDQVAMQIGSGPGSTSVISTSSTVGSGSEVRVTATVVFFESLDSTGTSSTASAASNTTAGTTTTNSTTSTTTNSTGSTTDTTGGTSETQAAGAAVATAASS